MAQLRMRQSSKTATENDWILFLPSFLLISFKILIEVALDTIYNSRQLLHGAISRESHVDKYADGTKVTLEKSRNSISSQIKERVQPPNFR